MNRSFSEKFLLLKIRTNRDEQAFARLYDTYVEQIYRFVAFKVRTREEAEDITSDVFLRAWKHLTDPKSGESVRHFRGFLYQIARNRIIDLYRAKSREKDHTVSLDDMPPQGIPTYTQERVEVSQEVEELFALMAHLKQEYQEVLLLRYVEELSIAEIARIVGKKQTAVRVLLHRATKKLQALAADI